MKTKMTLILGLLAVALTVVAQAWQRGGIGIATTRKSDNEQWKIAAVFPGSPAEAAGIKTGWFLISVNGSNVVGMSSCMSAVAGPVGTSVTLELADPTMSRTNRVTVKRADVRMPEEFRSIFKPGSPATNGLRQGILIAR